MIRITTSILFLLLSFSGIAQECGIPGQSMGILAQENLDNWEYAGCTHFLGSISIQTFTSEGSPIMDLSALSDLEFIGGNLYINDNETLVNVDFLNKLKHVGGDLVIQRNDSLEVISLDSLTYVGGSLDISENTKLSHIHVGNHFLEAGSLNIRGNKKMYSLTGFNRLERLNGDFSVIANSALDSCASFAGVDSIFGQILFTGNLGLKNVHLLDSVQYVEKIISVFNMKQLESLTAFNRLQNHKADISFTLLPVIQKLDVIQGLRYMKGDLSANSLYLIKHLDFGNSLETIDGSISIRVDQELESLEGFDKLKTIQGDLDLSHNTILESIGGFSALESIQGRLALAKVAELKILDNFTSLTHLHALALFQNENLHSAPSLENLDTSRIKKIRIVGNSSFSPCSLDMICKLPKTTILEIEKNKEGCAELTELKAHCN